MALSKESSFTFSLLGFRSGSNCEEGDEMQSLLDNEEVPAGTSGFPFSDDVGPVNQGSPRVLPSTRSSSRQNGPALHGVTTDSRSGMTQFPDVHVVNMPSSSSAQQGSHDSHVHPNLRRGDLLGTYNIGSSLMMDSEMEENVKCLVSSGIFFAIVIAVFVIMFVLNPMM